MNKSDYILDPQRRALVAGMASGLSLLTMKQLVGKMNLTGKDEKLTERQQQLIFDATKKITLEGAIIDRHGTILKSQGDTPGAAAPVEEAAFDFIGYNSDLYGLSGLRKAQKQWLYTDAQHSGSGCTLQLTMDADLQRFCYSLIGSSRGAVVVLNADTGEVLACASRRAAQAEYDVDSVDEMFESYSEYREFWLDPALASLQPPGSVYKIVTAAAMLHAGMGDFVYDDGGEEKGVHNYGNAVYGAGITLKKAAKNSINTFFAKAGQLLGRDTMTRMATAFGMNQSIALDWGGSLNAVADPGKSSAAVLARFAYGQGDGVNLRVSPMNLALVMSALVNGTVMQPHMVQHVSSIDGEVLQQATRQQLSQPLEEAQQQALQEIFRGVAQHYGLTAGEDAVVYAKTGTAFEADGKTNAVHLALGVEIAGKRLACCLSRFGQKHGVTSGSLKPAAQQLLDYLQANASAASAMDSEI